MLVAPGVIAPLGRLNDENARGARTERKRAARHPPAGARFLFLVLKVRTAAFGSAKQEAFPLLTLCFRV